MDGDEFIKKVKKYGKRNGVAVRFDCKQGKGSHGTLYCGNNKTTVKGSEIGKGLLAAMLKQLGIDKENF
jgi:mRNA interferase HicA